MSAFQPSLIKTAVTLVRYNLWLIVIFVLTALSGTSYLLINVFAPRPIPDNWKTYTNKYYGYSVAYDPQAFLLQVDPFGSEDGEDLSISLDKINFSELEKSGTKPEWFFRDYSRRGILPDPAHISWRLNFSKPFQLQEDEYTNIKRNCRPKRSRSSAIYLSCNGNTWYIPISGQYSEFSPYVSVSIHIESSTNDDKPSKEDRDIINKILSSISLNPDDTYLSYPSKNRLENLVNPNLCAAYDNRYENFDTCESGLKKYEPYFIASSSRIIKTVTLTKPYSYCEFDLDDFPNVSNSKCPYPSRGELYDSHALGKCDDHPLCPKPLPLENVYDNSPVDKMKALNQTTNTLSIPTGWKYYTRETGNYAIAVPSGWKVSETEGGAQAPGSDVMVQFKTMNLAEPNRKVSLAINDAADMPLFLNEKDLEQSFEKLGKFFCGRYASCELIRYRSSSPVFQAPIYEYALLRLDQANFFKKPKQILLYIYDENGDTKLIKMADSMVKTLVSFGLDD